MKTLKVIDYLQTATLLTFEKGKELLTGINNILGQYEVIVIDFSGYDFISSSFINNSFGQLALDKNWNYNDLIKAIKIIGLDEDDQDEIKLAVYNAMNKRHLSDKGINVKEFYSKNLAY